MVLCVCVVGVGRGATLKVVRKNKQMALKREPALNFPPIALIIGIKCTSKCGNQRPRKRLVVFDLINEIINHKPVL